MLVKRWNRCIEKRVDYIENWHSMPSQEFIISDLPSYALLSDVQTSLAAKFQSALSKCNFNFSAINGQFKILAFKPHFVFSSAVTEHRVKSSSWKSNRERNTEAAAWAKVASPQDVAERHKQEKQKCSRDYSITTGWSRAFFDGYPGSQ